MDFFAHQDAARKKTLLLVFYFLIAVLLIVLAVYVAVAAIFLVRQGAPGAAKPQAGAASLWDPTLFPWVAGLTVLVIVIGSMYKVGVLSSGGEVVARMLGGRPIDPTTQDLDERVVLNVVEEMAIASGTPVPAVYLLDAEPRINAFAAGFTPNDAVIGVTRGAVETLSRDELQGVIAHEFSHILNGDMRLNIRLIGVLNGILLIALIGYQLLRYAPRGGRDRKGGGAAGMFLLGVAFLVIGGIGVFFGKLIKSAVSRQREFLADASAVQFTRNPQGIAGALKKIGGLGSRVGHAKAEEASHLFFGNALRASFLNLMSTHPPLDVRICRIDPSFDGTYPEVQRQRRTARDLLRADLEERKQRHLEGIRARSADKLPAEARAASFAFEPSRAVASVGAPDTQHAAYAAAVLSSLPERLAEVVHDPLGAVTAVYGLLLSDDSQVRRLQQERLESRADRRILAEARRVVPMLSTLSPEARLPLVAMTVPALQKLSPAQYQEFRAVVRDLVEADRRISLFEFALQRMLLRHLAPRFERPKRRAIQYHSLRPLASTCAALLSALAQIGQRDAASARKAFAQAAEKLVTEGVQLAMLPPGEVELKRIDSALAQLASASPQVKKRVIEACATCVGADGHITVEEAELLRVIADSLDCPMPPLLAGEPSPHATPAGLSRR